MGVWKEYCFDFVADYKERYGRNPGSLHRIFVIAYECRCPSIIVHPDVEHCDLYVDNIRGCGGE